MLPACRAFGAAALLLALSGQVATAATHKLICQNSRQEYLVVFDSKSNTFIINPDTNNVAYTVVSAKRSEDGLVVRGKTVNGGPDFDAFFGDGPAIAYGTDQVDYCRHV
ncbi:hypothetical protein [Amaricoccus sp.]|uniref:hypothetical protein n=1 Tax=Amaricoccus sp. TaxID=1872485 RepID=UPI001B79F761|nr:hypothetical protein [Amaricoccus sp.]MBP7240849.1 hypothetical protein [Amaricoccus sp.]